MTKSELISVMTEAEAKRLMTLASRNGWCDPGFCRFCEKLIQIGDVFVRKRQSGRLKSSVVKYYHKQCWRKLLH
jgi:hypothetical protein